MFQALVILSVIACIYLLIRAGKWAAESSWQKDLKRHSDKLDKEEAKRLEDKHRLYGYPPTNS
jgi:cytochrome c-type biogenesis protein CcmH/NrfG